MKISKKVRQRLKERKTIFLLPSLLTTCSLYAGFYSITASVSGNFFYAAVAIIISGVFDSLDGKIARITRTTSQFGVEYDSLSDLIAFGVAPGVLVYVWALQPFGRLGWVVGFLYVACGALRLARFNTNVGYQDPTFFQGLSIPTGAGMIAASVFFFEYIKLPETFKNWIMLTMAFILAFLMVSNFKYYSFKGELISRKPFNTLVVAVLVIALISVKPQIVLFVMGIVYIASGPILSVVYAKKFQEDEEVEEADLESNIV